MEKLLKFKHLCFSKREWMVVYCLLIFCVGLNHSAMTRTALAADVSEQNQDAESNTASKGKWLPIPIFVTEPAIGYGLGVGLGYIHPEKENIETEDISSFQTLSSATSGRSGQKPPPTITGIAAGYTEKDTWAAAFAHATSWRKDTIRYAGGAAYADVNSEYYIINQAVDFSLKGLGIYQDIKFRFGESRWFLGGKFLYTETESQFDFSIDEDTEIGLGDIFSRNIGLAAEVTYDGRDNVFTPNKGQLLQIDIWRFDEGLGGDYNYWKAKFKLLSFFSLHERFVLGVRLETSVIDGSAPFYVYPYVGLRGVPALRYQGRRADMIEAEGRWNILPRWALVVFAGAGAVHYEGDSSFRLIKDDIYTGGLGVRYFLMPEMGLWLGVDVSKGPEDWYSYITVGQAW